MCVVSKQIQPGNRSAQPRLNKAEHMKKFVAKKKKKNLNNVTLFNRAIIYTVKKSKETKRHSGPLTGYNLFVLVLKM